MYNYGQIEKELVHVRENTEYLKLVIPFITANVWNHIPLYVKNKISKFSFKSVV